LAFHSGREADHSPPSSAEVKEWVELYFHSPQYAFMAWCSVRGSTWTTLLLPWSAHWMVKRLTKQPTTWHSLSPRHAFCRQAPSLFLVLITV
jgi:hypothetical protein